jgi:hypothetical protein
VKRPNDRQYWTNSEQGDEFQRRSAHSFVRPVSDKDYPPEHEHPGGKIQQRFDGLDP